MNLAHIAQNRHACKAFDASKPLPPELFAQLETLLRYTPSSINSQPWHFVLATSSAGKEQIARAMPDGFAYNQAKVRNAPLVVVLCRLREMSDAHIVKMIAQEAADGRFATPEDRTKRQTACDYYVNVHRQLGDTQAWMGKQVYLALGSLLLGAAALGLDACPIEGFDAALLDQELNLPARGLQSLVIAAIGYRSDADFNAKLPKSRLPEASVISRI